MTLKVPSEESGMENLSTVLVLDSDSRTRNTISYELKRNGFRVSSTSGGQKAFELFPRMQFDLVIASLEQAEGSGLDLLKVFRDRQITIPVLFTAGGESVPDEALLIQQGASGFFPKPIKPALVMEKVHKALRRAG